MADSVWGRHGFLGRVGQVPEQADDIDYIRNAVVLPLQALAEKMGQVAGLRGTPVYARASQYLNDLNRQIDGILGQNPGAGLNQEDAGDPYSNTPSL